MPLYTMKEILKDAQERHYGVGYFNAINQEMVRAYIRAAEELNSPIIVGTSEGLLSYSEFEWISPMLIQAARNAKVPVAVHLDHTYNFQIILKALRNGFGSVMYDGSRLSYEKNINISAEIAKIVHPMGVGLECEVGCVGGLEDNNNQVDVNKYTDPMQAAEFVDNTGADFLAVSIGTIHGVYKTVPKLDLIRLAEIRNKVDVPLVLHGGSGLSDEDIRSTIKYGICKVNIYTDVILAAKKAIVENIQLSYTDLMIKAENAMVEVVIKKLGLFSSSNKA